MACASPFCQQLSCCECACAVGTLQGNSCGNLGPEQVSCRGNRSNLCANYALAWNLLCASNHAKRSNSHANSTLAWNVLREQLSCQRELGMARAVVEWSCRGGGYCMGMCGRRDRKPLKLRTPAIYPSLPAGGAMLRSPTDAEAPIDVTNTHPLPNYIRPPRQESLKIP